MLIHGTIAVSARVAAMARVPKYVFYMGNVTIPVLWKAPAATMVPKAK